MTAARFEVVRGDHGWHARFRASNGRVLFWTETYTRRETALRAIGAMTRPLNATVTNVGVRTICQHFEHAVVEVRDVDSRTASASEAEPDWERCDYFSTDIVTTRSRSRADGWRCGEEKGHTGSHVLYSVDGERVLYSASWGQRP